MTATRGGRLLGRRLRGEVTGRSHCSRHGRGHLRAAGGGPSGRRSAGQRGIHALLNFAPQVINVPIGTAVHYVDFSIELQILMYHLNNGTGPLGGGLLHSLGILTPAPMRGA